MLRLGTRRIADTRERGLLLNGIAGNEVFTPHTAALAITSDIFFKAKLFKPSWNGATVNTVIGKNLAGAARAYALSVAAGGTLTMTLSVDGSAINNIGSVDVVPWAFNTTPGIGWIGGTWRASDGRVQFFTALDASGRLWTQLGTDKTIAIASIFNAATAPLEVGARVNGNSEVTFGRIMYAAVGSGLVLDATPAAEFDASRYVSGDTLTSRTGEVWNLRKTGLEHARIAA